MFDDAELDEEGVGMGETMLLEWDSESGGGGEVGRRLEEKNFVGLKRFSSLDEEFVVDEEFGSEELCLDRGNWGEGLTGRE